MKKPRIITDHKWHNFKYRNEVPKKVLKDQFSHLDKDDNFDNFFKYKNYWYHISDFIRVENIHENDEFHKWHGYTSDTFFSGVLIKMDEDNEQYMVGMYFS